MANVYGADVQALSDLASFFDQAASQLAATRQSVGAKVQQSAWAGPVADRFRSDWSSTNNSKIASATQLLRGAALTLRKNAAEQTQVSAAEGNVVGRSLTPTATSDGSGADIASRLTRLGVQTASEAVNALDLVKVLTAGKSFGSVAEFADKLGQAKVSPILSVVGMGFSANDLGMAIGNKDQGAMLGSSLDLIVAGIGVVVPGAGLAWDTGKLIGTGIYDGVQTFWNTPDSATAEALREMYGTNVDINHLTQAQAAALSDRYTGPLGIFNSVNDSVNGAAHDFGTWLGNGIESLVNG